MLLYSKLCQYNAKNYFLTLLLFLNFLNKNVSKIYNEGIFEMSRVWKVFLNESLIVKLPTISFLKGFNNILFIIKSTNPNSYSIFQIRIDDPILSWLKCFSFMVLF